jgi:hypothetical protein
MCFQPAQERELENHTGLEETVMQAFILVKAFFEFLIIEQHVFIFIKKNIVNRSQLNLAYLFLRKNKKVFCF